MLPNFYTNKYFLKLRISFKGGLYLPAFYPQFTFDDLRALRGRSFAELALTILAPYICGDQILDLSALMECISDAYAQFKHPAVCPLVQLGPNEFLLELFHGPTLAFKGFNF